MGLSRNKFIRVLFLSVIITLPFDSFPLPINSVYKPLSIIPILITFFYSLKINGFKLFIKPFLVLFLLLLLLTSFLNSFLIDIYSGFNLFIIEIIILVITVGSFNFFIGYLSPTNFKKILNQGVEIVINLFIIIGSLQLMGRFIDPGGLIEKLNSIFLYRSDLSRIQFLSGEPSYGVRMVILFLTLKYYVNNKFHFNLKTLWLLILVLFSGSTFGLYYIVIFMTLLLIINYKYSNKIIINTCLIGVFFFAFYHIIPLTQNFISDYAKSKIDSAFSIINHFTMDNLVAIAQIDGSIFLRIFNPIIGLKMFLDNFFIGVGGENFTYHYLDYIIKDYPFALQYDAVESVYYENTRITPKSMIGKLLSEFGALGLIILIFLIKICLNVKDKFIIPLSAYVMSVLVNYDSYIYFPLILAICLIYYQNSKTFFFIDQ